MAMRPDIARPANPAWFAGLTFPSLRPRLVHGGRSSVALGATILGKPVGLCLGDASSNTAEILSIAVATQHRRRGIATMLLQAMENELASQGCGRVSLGYSSHSPFATAIERILHKSDWPEPRATAIVCESDLDTISKAPWMKRARFPPDFEIFSWDQLTSAERARLSERRASYPEWLSPLREEEKIFAFGSLGLRHRGEVAGWVIAQRIREVAIRYKTLFMREDLHARGRGISLLAESILRHRGTPICRATFTVDTDNLPMMRFVRRRMEPYLLRLSTTFRTSRIIEKR